MRFQSESIDARSNFLTIPTPLSCIPHSVSCFYMQIIFKTKGPPLSLIARVNTAFRPLFTVGHCKLCGLLCLIKEITRGTFSLSTFSLTIEGKKSISNEFKWNAEVKRLAILWAGARAWLKKVVFCYFLRDYLELCHKGKLFIVRKLCNPGNLSIDQPRLDWIPPYTVRSPWNSKFMKEGKARTENRNPSIVIRYEMELLREDLWNQTTRWRDAQPVLQSRPKRKHNNRFYLKKEKRIKAEPQQSRRNSSRAATVSWNNSVLFISVSHKRGC